MTLVEDEEVDSCDQGVHASKTPQPGRRETEAQAARDQRRQKQDAQLEREQGGVEAQACPERDRCPRERLWPTKELDEADPVGGEDGAVDEDELEDLGPELSTPDLSMENGHYVGSPQAAF